MARKRETEPETPIQEISGTGVEETDQALEGEVEVEEPEAELETLREELDQCQAQVAEYLDGWQRTRAEFSNFRKRQETERAKIITFANAGLLRKLLPVFDDFDRAIANMPDEVSGSNWVDGLFLIRRKLDGILESEGVLPIESEGKEFDPRYHEAVTYEEAEGFHEGQIINVIQQGFTLGDQVLQPALVRVAKAPAAPTNENGGNSDDKE